MRDGDGGRGTDVGKGATCFSKKNQGTRDKNLTEKTAASVQETGSKAERKWETLGKMFGKLCYFVIERHKREGSHQKWRQDQSRMF